MQNIQGLAVAAVLLGVGAKAPATAIPEPQSAVWQAHHVQFDYFGITARYTCDGIEDQVKQILLYLGARRDAKVNASGCPLGGSSLSRSIFVVADFTTLSLASPNGNNGVTATLADWIPIQVESRRPSFMSDGDCELIEQMRKLVTESFSWRGTLSYSASCTPHETQMHDYSIQGEILKPAVAARRPS
jgi:hypothetical protein